MSAGGSCGLFDFVFMCQLGSQACDNYSFLLLIVKIEF